MRIGRPEGAKDSGTEDASKTHLVHPFCITSMIWAAISRRLVALRLRGEPFQVRIRGLPKVAISS